MTTLPGLYPKTMYINRGNHETKEMNRTYGFEGEAKHKHGEQTYKVCTPILFPFCRPLTFCVAFRACLHDQSVDAAPHVVRRLTLSPVPLATLICATKPPSGFVGNAILSPEGKKRYFVVHGGLFSKDGVTLDDIRKIERIGRQPGQEGLMCM